MAFCGAWTPLTAGWSLKDAGPAAASDSPSKNSKHEIRNSKQYQNSNIKCLKFWILMIGICLGFRN